MKIYHEKFHPNGFKIFLALKCSKFNNGEINEYDEVKNGAQLEVEHEGLCYNLNPNSAVGYLLDNEKDQSETSKIIQEWLDWDGDVKESLHSYLGSVINSKSDVSIPEELSLHLSFLNGGLSLTPNYIIGKLSQADVILYVSLLPLLVIKKVSKVLKSFAKLEGYLKFLRNIKEFQDTEQLYYGKAGFSVSWLSNQSAASFSKKNSVWNLIKKKDGQSQPKSENASPSTKAVPAHSQQEEREISLGELQNAEKEWCKDLTKVSPREERKPILPISGERNVLITSALPYVNNVPHLGNIIGCVLSADCFARFCRSRGDNVLYICGTDEYGTATETKAVAENCTPKEICDKYYKIHSDVYDWFNIEFDHFGRTTTHHQTEIAQSIFWDLQNNKNITQNIVEQLYCNKCSIFLADRFVEGTCPNIGCGFEDARGDQCDGCGKLVNAIELINPRCKFCSQMPAVRESQHLFLNLPKIEAEVNVWIKESSPNWTNNARVICEAWLRDGLKERCITRDLKWGTPVPIEGFKDKVFYVWYDAPIGYISMTMEYTNEWSKWWMNPGNIAYYQFMAKDNVPFHGVIFPCTLLGTNKSWTKVTHLIATEYLNYEDGKFSKSRGVGVFGDHTMETGISSDVWRFYLLYLRPENHDTAFSWIDLQTKNNSELLNNVGNFVNRSLKFVYQFYGGELPPSSPTKEDYVMMASINQEIDRYTNLLSNCRLRDGIRVILSITRIGNQYIQENEPYKLIKPDRSDDDKKRGATVINIAANIVGLVAVLLEPYMPQLSSVILDLLNNPPVLKVLPYSLSAFLLPGHKIKEPYPLIRKITDDEIAVLQRKFRGNDESKQPPKAKPVQQTATVQVTKELDPEEIKRLEGLVTDQGAKVRELKAEKASKEIIGKEVTSLLALKQQLMLAQGIDPSKEVKPGKKKKK